MIKKQLADNSYIRELIIAEILILCRESHIYNSKKLSPLIKKNNPNSEKKSIFDIL